ncbi:ABC transporter ATP-binding protein [Nocardiopsis mangrovi]|uniref:ABC transporter ATP-binding protein n=1 Tax=Nocardiopsis mangrovi TaxID=1179818 RepID=A0ABV9DYQ2_9ACTN
MFLNIDHRSEYTVETDTSPRPDDPPVRWANLRLLWSFVRPHRWVLALGIVLGLVATGTSLATPLVTKEILDGLAETAPIAPWVGVLVALLVVGGVVGLVQWIMMGRLGEQVVLSVRTSMVRRLFRVRIDELAGRSSGEFVTRVTSDTVLMREAVASSVVGFVNSIVGLVGALLLMATLDLVLLGVVVAVIAMVTGLIAGLMPRLAEAQKQAQAAIGRVGAALEGAMRAIRTVKASRAEERESDRVVSEAEESARQGIRAVRIEAVAWTITGTGISLAIMLVLAIGAYRVSAEALTVSALVAFLLYVFQLMMPAMELSQVVTSLQSGIAAAARIAEVDRLGVEPDSPRTTAGTAPDGAPGDGGARGAGAGRRTAPGPVLSFHGVTARYAPGSAPVLDGVSVDIARTGHTAIVGPSGAGKTTMFSLMLRFLQPEHGHIALDGVPLPDWPLDELRRRIAYVEQETPLVPGTLADNLRYTHPEADDDALWEALRAVRLDERARTLEQGLDTPLSTAVISGGERQRIALARALVSDPEILLLDEATAQLDGLTEAAIQHSIGELAARGAVVTIAHRLSTVIDADRIIVLEAGRPRAIGTHAELLRTDDLYRELVAALRIATPAAEPDPAV